MAHEEKHFSGLLCISRGTWTIPFRSYHHQLLSLVAKPNNYVAKLVTNEDAAADFDVDYVEIHKIVLRLITEPYVIAIFS